MVPSAFSQDIFPKRLVINNGDSIVAITLYQAKVLNSVFIQRDDLSNQVYLKDKKIANLNSILDDCNKLSIIDKKNIEKYQLIIDSYDQRVNIFKTRITALSEENEKNAKKSTRNRKWAVATSITSFVLLGILILK